MQFFSRCRRYSALWYALHFSVLRPSHPAGAWGPQLGIGLLVVWIGLHIGPRGGTHDLRLTWPWRSEPLLVLTWAGRDMQRQWGLREDGLWLGRVVVRVLSPGRAAASLLRLLTHGTA